ncbi:MAG: hypothetical protein LBU58_02850, partial [Clostridiales bacterium]|nr:hypothetical protein [Clostridiales bacterium]
MAEQKQGAGKPRGRAGAAAKAAAVKAAEDAKKTQGQLLSEKLSFELKSCWETADERTRGEVTRFAESYKTMLDGGKTEREFSARCREILEKNGYQDIEQMFDSNTKLTPGTKVYQNIHGKSLIFAIIGKNPVAEGVNIVGAHVDSPRIDLKTNPLYEDTGFAMLDTQYYGGIKKYQWVTIPLALHGVIIKTSGERVEVCIGEAASDPVFTITDLLPHLARIQMEKKASEVIPGEGLNVLAGTIPYPDDKVKEKVKLNLLKLLNDAYGIVEEDFASAELEIVPASKARDVGFDRSMIGAYGHDDRSCAYAAVRALTDIGNTEAKGGGKGLYGAGIPKRTCVCVLTDKEETGSAGNTGAESKLFENFIAYLCDLTTDHYTDIALRRCLSRSYMLSAD